MLLIRMPVLQMKAPSEHTPPNARPPAGEPPAQEEYIMATSTRLADVIVKLPDRSTCRVQRRLVIKRSTTAPPEPEYICSLPTGEPVTWLRDGKYRLPDGTVAVAVAHRPPSK